jgi:excisionase family DNA binding protein
MRTKNRGSGDAVGERSTLRGPLLDLDAVAQVLGVTRRHVQHLVSEKRIPYLKVGRFVRFDPAELNVWLDHQRVAPERSGPRDYATWR